MIYNGILMMGTIFVCCSSLYFLWRASFSAPRTSFEQVEHKLVFTLREIEMALSHAERPPTFHIHPSMRSTPADIVVVHAADRHLDVYRFNAGGRGRLVSGLEIDRADALFDKMHGQYPVLRPVPKAA